VPDVEHTGFTAAELEQLLALRPGPSAIAMATLLMVDTHDDSLLTGAASLLNRGRARVTPTGGIELVGSAERVSRILTSASRWTIFAVSADDVTGNSFLVESPEGKLIAEPRGPGIWWFLLLHPTAAAAQIVSLTALELARDSDPGHVVVRTASTTQARSFNIGRTGEAFSFAAGDDDASQPEISVEYSSDDEVAEHLSEFITGWPRPLVQ